MLLTGSLCPVTSAQVNPKQGFYAYPLVFDGANIWVAGGGSTPAIVKVRVSDGLLLGTYPLDSESYGLAFDGANIWIPQAESNEVIKMRASDGQMLNRFPTEAWPFGTTFDGANIWVCHGHIGGTVAKM